MNDQPEQHWPDLLNQLGYRFAIPALLTEALTHRSFANESREPGMPDNERLEFLGDAILDLVISHVLFISHPVADEGELTRLRAELVSEPSLAGIARSLSLGDSLLLGRGECRSGGRARSSLLADTFEAVLGAVFLDGGYPAAAAVIRRVFAPYLTSPVAPSGLDYKTRLQELLQSRRQQRPAYRLVGESGPDHQRSYEVEVLVGSFVRGRGTGGTKKAAEQEAARKALAEIDRRDDG